MVCVPHSHAIRFELIASAPLCQWKIGHGPRVLVCPSNPTVEQSIQSFFFFFLGFPPHPNQAVPASLFGSSSFSGPTKRLVVRFHHHSHYIYILLKFLFRYACRKARRKRHTVLFLVEVMVQWLNLAFYITPNVYLLLHRCLFLFPAFKWCGWLSWTCWNTVGAFQCTL